MKICFVAPFVYPLFNRTSRVVHGGAEMDVYFIGLALSQQPGYTVSYVVGDFGQPKTETYGQIKLFSSFRTCVTGWRKILAMVGVIPALFRAMDRAQAEVYLQEGASFETALVALYCRMKRRQFVYRVASSVECDGKIVKMFPLMGRVFLWGLRKADAIVTEDQEEVDLLAQHYHLVAQAIYDTTPIPPETDIIPIDQRQHILWVSRLVEMKRPEIFIALAQHFPQEKFVLIGVPDPNNPALTHKIESLKKNLSNLTFIPGLPFEKLDGYYKTSKLLINTSDFEGYPNTFIEAGKYAVPILSLLVNPDNLFANNRFGACANGSTEQLRVLLQEWLSDVPKRERVGRALSQHVRATSDMSKNVMAYDRLFTTLVN